MSELLDGRQQSHDDRHRLSKLIYFMFYNFGSIVLAPRGRVGSGSRERHACFGPCELENRRVTLTFCDLSAPHHSTMYLMYYLDDKGNRVYTMQKVDQNGHPTFSAHPGKTLLAIQ